MLNIINSDCGIEKSKFYKKIPCDQELIHFAHTAIQRGNFSEDRCRRDVSTFLTGEILILSHVLHIVKKKVFSF